MYQVYAQMYGREFIQVHYDDTLKVTAEQIISKLDESVDLLVLLNPNNPVGDAYTNEEFEAILEATKRYEINLLVDEAYMYFYDNTFIKYAVENPHVLLTRTFSKLFSLAGLRLGYVVGQPQDVKMVSNLCTPHNTNAIAMRFAQAILEEPGMLDDLIKRQLDGKRFIVERLEGEGFTVSAKEGNFIFVKPRKVDADVIVERMKNEKQILIKSYSGIGSLGKCLRVTTGEQRYMERFLGALLELDK
jgi:histidinol-phosphate aminotransferase